MPWVGKSARSTRAAPFSAQCILTLFSSRQSDPTFVDRTIPEHSPQDINPATSQSNHGLLGGLAFGALSPVVGLAGLVAGDRAERRAVEDSFEGLLPRRALRW